MPSSEKSAIRRFFTERPQTRTDFVLTWVGISAVPIVMWPILGFLTGEMSEALTRILPSLIVVPIVSGLVLTYVYSTQKQDSSLRKRSAGDPER
ncbi:hypothetical protein BC102111_02235 [Brevibacterium casei CIP 102111]|uniref:Uncharacterized protein n=2 Tax=Brevibacterium casei TaxID=33889 RepID=A0A2H1JHG0_9MICO|nr:hypothetical protein [Brevibacterium casei]SMX86602.1 hypothetical protein BC102111_02235 [Brevibacterium casei CIP 102111]MDH5147176.1 hypothetical protein [Brevibacterium casei]PAK97180.1 hypothetical protein B8X04_00965 [Brevibacterium casei]QPR39115.1 hypothetical protein I6G94_16525 [Brevibacterium casei]QPR43281.1 hypothetical protein I6G93_14170 [Brevibacterium casei]